MIGTHKIFQLLHDFRYIERAEEGGGVKRMRDREGEQGGKGLREREGMGMRSTGGGGRG